MKKIRDLFWLIDAIKVMGELSLFWTDLRVLLLAIDNPEHSQEIQCRVTYPLGTDNQPQNATLWFHYLLRSFWRVLKQSEVLLHLTSFQPNLFFHSHVSSTRPSTSCFWRLGPRKRESFSTCHGTRLNWANSNQWGSLWRAQVKKTTF